MHNFEGGTFVFFDRLKQLCDEKGISTYKAATEIGLNRAAANKWKGGSIPNGQTLSKLADYFGVTTDYLLGDETEKAPTDEGERQDVLDEVDIAFYGDFKELSEADQDVIRNMVAVMRQRRAAEK